MWYLTRSNRKSMAIIRTIWIKTNDKMLIYHSVEFLTVWIGRSQRSNPYRCSSLRDQCTNAVDTAQGSSRLASPESRFVKRANFYCTCTSMALLGKADRTSKASSRSNISRWLVYALERIVVNNDTVPPPLDDWPASRHVTGTGLLCYPFRPEQAPASLERNPILDVCGGKILTTTQGLEIAPAARRTGVPGHAVVSHWGFLASRTR